MLISDFFMVWLIGEWVVEMMIVFGMMVFGMDKMW